MIESVKIIPVPMFKSAILEKKSINKLTASNRTNEINDITRKRMINCGKANLIASLERFFVLACGGLTV